MYDSNNVPNVQGLDKLLLAIADKLEGNVDGLNKELLTQSAYRIMRLEEAALEATMLLSLVPRKSKDRSQRSMVPREMVKTLASRLHAAGYNVKNFV